MDQRTKSTLMNQLSRRGILAWLVVALPTLGAVLTREARADQVVDARAPYVDVARRLEGWIAAEVAAKGLPALSIALVDDQRIVWARGFGFADPKKRIPGHGRDGLPGRLGLQAVHRPGGHAARRAGPARPRCAGESLPARIRAPEPVQRADHAAPVDVAPLGTGARAAGRPLLRSRLRRRSIEVVRSLAGTTLVFEPGTRTKYSNAGVTVVGAVVERVRGEPFPKAIEPRPVRAAGHVAIELRAGPRADGGNGPRNDVDLRRPDRRDSDLPARHRPGGQPVSTVPTWADS